MAASYTFTSVVWEHDGPGAWHFANLPTDCADDIADAMAGRARGFGSVRVSALIGGTRWSTSVFPDKRLGTYLLPIKKAVRSAEMLHDGTSCRITIDLIDDQDAGV